VSGNLQIGDRARYEHVRDLITHDFPTPIDIVELGAAPGDQICTYAKLGHRATALDLDEAADEWGTGETGRMRRILSDNDVRFVQWDLEQTPYPLDDDAFDVVLMTEVYEHLREYPIRSLQEARRVLRPGGRLYFTTPNAAYALNRVQLLRGRSVATALPDWIGGLPHARHAREYTFAEVRELMTTAGLRIVREESRHFYTADGGAPARAAKTVIDRVARIRPTLGPAIVVVAEA
jgi:SAM-dependent methyltransferase